MAIQINGNGTITGISVGGLPNGIVDTDMLAANAVTADKRGAGAVLQVQQKIKTSAWAASVGSSGTVPTGMYQTITTKTDTSKVLVFVNMTLLVDGSYNGSAWSLMRNSGTDNVSGGTEIFIGDADGSRTRKTMAMTGPVSTTGAFNGFSCGTQFQDSPGSAGAYTYFIKFFDTVTSDNYFYLNRGYNDDNDQNQPRSTSSITLMEIAA
jgi:hypothetical protein